MERCCSQMSLKTNSKCWFWLAKRTFPHQLIHLVANTSASVSDTEAEGLCLSPSYDPGRGGRLFFFPSTVKSADRWCCYLTADPDCCCGNARTLHVGQRDEQVGLHLHGQTGRQAVVVLNADHLPRAESGRRKEGKSTAGRRFTQERRETVGTD